MANCSIPNSSPASGRISTRSSRRSRRQNSGTRVCPSVSRGWWLDIRKRRQAAVLQSALRASQIPRWTLDVQRSEFSAIRRAKGAWWPPRSSKPSSPRKWRGRFDSYPLRLFICDCRCPIADWFNARRMISIANRNSKIENSPKGGDINVA